MAKLLGIDVGSSSVIAGILDGKKVVKESSRAFFRSLCQRNQVEVSPQDLMNAVRKAVRSLGPPAKKVDAINLAVMSPAWVVMDKKGKPLTNIVTHQDRRSVAEAIALEKRLGASHHLRLCGSRPIPGGISSTTWSWFKSHAPAQLQKADLVGHLNTFLHRQMTGARVTDPSNAAFMGLYETLTLKGWSKELCDNLGVSEKLLPEVVDADVIGGTIHAAAAKAFGLREGTPMMVGLMDGSAGVLRAGTDHGQLFNVVGSTDVLALCTEKPKPHRRLLTRPLGIGRKWLSVSTLAAAASSIYWARDQFFPEIPVPQFHQHIHRLSRRGPTAAGGVTFSPYMAGERTSIEQRQGALSGITLGTTRDNLLSAIIEGLVQASAERIPLLEQTGTPLLKTVMVSGGSDRLDKIFHRDWPGQWHYRSVTDATLRGLATMEPREG